MGVRGFFECADDPAGGISGRLKRDEAEMMIQKMNFGVIVRKMMSLVGGPVFCLALLLPGSVVATADHACDYLA